MLNGYAAEAPDPAACAVLLARRVSDPERLGDLLNAAETLWPEKPAEAAEILAHAHELAKASGKTAWLESVARRYAKLGQKAKALELAAQLLGDGGTNWAKEWRAPVFLAELGEIQLAVELLKTGEPGPPWGYPRLALLARQWLAAGQKGKALDLLAQVEEEAKRAECGDHWQAGPCEAAAEGYAAAGEFDRALAAAERIPETLHHMAFEGGEERFSPVRYKVTALVKIALWCAKAGEEKRGLEVLARARGIAQRIRHRRLRCEMLKEVAVAYTGAMPEGLLYRGTEWASRPPLDPTLAVETALGIDHPLVKARALHDVAGRLLEAGRKSHFLTAQSDAVQIALGIEDTSPDASVSGLDFICDSKCGVLFHLATAYAQVGEKAKAVDVLTRMAPAARGVRFPTERAETMAGLAERLAELGETKLAVELAVEAVELARHEKVSSFHHYKARVLAAVGQAHLAVGGNQRAWELFTVAIQVAKGPKGTDDASYVLSGAAAHLAKAGRFSEAVRFAKLVERPGTRAAAFQEISRLRVQAGYYEEALEATREVGEPGARIVLLAAIGKRYPPKGAEPSPRARELLEELAR
ncbi:MAG: hypothetical protein FJ291_11930 [Planctomycetes bacterium]|nr:hypothetical protein [Planctomycetota bacterium]